MGQPVSRTELKGFGNPTITDVKSFSGLTLPSTPSEARLDHPGTASTLRPQPTTNIVMILANYGDLCRTHFIDIDELGTHVKNVREVLT